MEEMSKTKTFSEAETDHQVELYNMSLALDEELQKEEEMQKRKKIKKTKNAKGKPRENVKEKQTETGDTAEIDIETM